MPDIAIEGGEVVPRSIGESKRYRTIIQSGSANIGPIPIAAVMGETPIHRAQRVVSRIPSPMLPRPTPFKNILLRLFPRIG